MPPGWDDFLLLDHTKISRKHPKGHLLETKICYSEWVVRKVDRIGEGREGKGRRQGAALLGRGYAVLERVRGGLESKGEVG